MKKILSWIGKILNYIVFFLCGLFVCYMIMDTKGLLNARETEEFANLLQIEAERYDYCPYCGEKLSYKYNCPIKDSEKQRIIEEWYGK